MTDGLRASGFMTDLASPRRLRTTGARIALALCVGAWIAFGRLNRVFDVDGACRVGAPLPG